MAVRTGRPVMWMVLTAALLVLGVGCATVDPAQAVPRQGTGRYEPLPSGGYERLIQGRQEPVVLLMYSPSCPYCRALMKKVRAGIADKGKPWVVYIVDIRQEPVLRSQLGVGPVPCTILYKGGKEVERAVGWRPGFTVTSKLDRFFGN